ncbi:MAG: lysophospholipid acyltransferase family protein [Candidatus Omnitrophota bacterium]|nr:lysophospholipid acyltransferase family protein [Candidatus Omnitrophota bacterium]
MFNYLLYRFAQFLVSHLPKKMAYALAISLSDIHFRLSHRERRWVRNNLKIIMNTQENLHFYSREVFRNFGKYLADFLRTPVLSQNNFKDYIELVNLVYVDEELKNGKGVILISAHMGNWELGGMGMAAAGYRVLVAALEHKDSRVNDFFIKQRTMQGVEVATLKNAGKKCWEALKDNKAVALVADRDFSGNGVVVKFFGKDTLIPQGPAVFSRRNNTAIVPAFVVRQPDDKFKLIFEPPIKPVITGSEEDDIREITQRVAKAIEEYVRRYPTQWLVFREFWVK